jgi:UPF0755 protein
MTSSKRLLFTLIIVFLTLCASVGLTWKNFLTTPLVVSELGIKYIVPQGASFKSVAVDLYNQRILRYPRFFMWLAYYRGVIHQLKAGEYFFPKNTTPSTLIEQIATGKGILYHAFTIIPGMNFQQLRAMLNKTEDLQHTTQNLSDTQIMKLLGQQELSPEGQFFPETYYFIKDTVDISLLKRALKTMKKKLAVAWSQRAVKLSFQTPYQALIAASIIEKEARVKEELPIIAGVMVNRLKKGMLLQFDPTVIYGAGLQYNGIIHKSDLQKNNPYNTYIHKGLPPTPIAMPGIDAIYAAMHPAVNDYLYFVAKGKSGTHQFSRTLREHKAAVMSVMQYR